MAHFSANCPATLLAAAQLVQPLCDAIDINLGCPQRVAHAGHFGSFLLDDADRALVLDMVRTLRAGLAVPVFVKIRLLETVDKTVELCAQLHQAGAALIAIHARHRVSLVARTGPGARDGPALLDYVAAVKRALPGAVIIANGNVRCFEDVESNLASTGADGVMSAEGLLDDPTLFAAGAAGARTEEQRLEVALEYLDLVDRWPAAVKTVVFHVRRMCCAALARLQLLEDCLCAASVPDVRRVVLLALGYLRDGGFVHDPDKEQRGREAAARRTSTCSAGWSRPPPRSSRVCGHSLPTRPSRSGSSCTLSTATPSTCSPGAAPETAPAPSSTPTPPKQSHSHTDRSEVNIDVKGATCLHVLRYAFK